MGIRGGVVCHIRAFFILPSAFSLGGAGVFVAQGVRGWRRSEGARPGQNNLLVLLPILPSPPPLQVLHCQT
jgi:hypothetical protein